MQPYHHHPTLLCYSICTFLYSSITLPVLSHLVIQPGGLRRTLIYSRYLLPSSLGPDTGLDDISSADYIHSYCEGTLTKKLNNFINYNISFFFKIFLSRLHWIHFFFSLNLNLWRWVYNVQCPCLFLLQLTKKNEVIQFNYLATASWS